ncbi:DMT family transporter [Pseudomonas alliivorans]|uniref:DMT family transporter n=1 Tax=Pseudomonas alliivorans TaxID=2810613 RepID=UPI002ECD0AC9|nr:DMT family transporter [Pseudomonas alliivorans]MEE4730475.1 DMT family transporter [Pseudomonas alliivorans]MEE5101247.1 DMT family transporter [Pseudomonas alliivorans]MEE5103566.1 DMT family transporter [Pseudomonas alliivorans]MEE5170113.1 DMT family transporter [Pseudomonas alliivorans]
MNQHLSIKHSETLRPGRRRSMPLPLLEAGLILTWSSGFIGARFSIDYAPPLLVVFWRCVLVCLILLPFVFRQLQRTSPAVLLKNAGIGLLAMTGYLAGITQGIALGVPAGLAALFADLLPIGMALLAALFLGQRLAWRVWTGLVIGLSGVVIATQGALAWGKAPLWAYGLPLLGMLSLAVATLWRKRLTPSQTMGLLPNLWLQCCVSGIVFAVVEGVQGGLAPIPGTGFALSVAWTAGLSTLCGYGLYWVCLRRASETRVASVLYLSPPVTMLLAWIMFDEPLSWQMVSGMVVSGIGIWVVIRAERRKAEMAR